MKNTLQRYLSMLIALFSVAIVAYGQTERFIGKGKVRAIQFSPDGRRLAIGTSAILELYEAKTSQLVHTIEMNVDALEFSPNGAEVMVADGRLLHRFDSTTGQVVGTLTGGEHRVSDLAYSPDGKQIASINNQGVVRLWEKHQEAFTFRHAAARRGKYSLLFSHDGRQLIVGAFDVEIWDIATVQLVGKFLTNSRVTTLALRSDGIQLAVGTEEGQIEFWSLQTCDRTEMIDGNDVEVEGLRGQVEVNSLAFGPNGRTLVVGFGDAVIAVWDTANQEWMRSWLTKTRPDEEFKGWEETNRYWPDLFTLSRDSRTVVALANHYANIGRWEIDTGKLIGRFEGYGYQQMLGFSADSEHFATFGGVARVWDTVTTEIIAEMQYDNGSYTAALSPNGKYVAITHRDRRITVWDVDTATVKHALRGAVWNRGGITFSPDSRLVAAVTFSFLIRVWDVETGEQIAGLHERDIGSGFSSGSIRFSPDGNWFAAEGARAIVVWETQGFTLQRIVNGLGKIATTTGMVLNSAPTADGLRGMQIGRNTRLNFGILRRKK